MFNRVKASGVGHSWWKEQFCSGNDSNSINLVMTELKPTLDFILHPVDPSQWRSAPIPADFPIKVDEAAATVTVAAGIPQRMLLDYLSEYRYWKQSDGWILPAFSWFIDQTIGGAVATGTHGSSMRWGSISSQVRGFKIIVANGTLLELGSPESSPEALHLWRAVGVSVGRLGIITELTLRIKPQQAVTRKLQDLSFSDFVRQVKDTQDAYNTAKAANDTTAIKQALFRVDETQVFWHVPLSQMWRTDYEHLDHEPLAVLLNVDQSDPTVQAMDGPSQNVFDQSHVQPVGPNRMMPLNTRYWANFYATSTRGFVTPGTYESRKAFLSMTEFGTRTSSTMAPYDQYEVAVPLEVAGDCLAEVGQEIYGSNKLWEGFRTPALVRFVTGEDFYLSPTNGGARMYVNMEDYISKSSGKPNEQFGKVIDLFLQRCNARFHWGKAGWPAHQKCFDGAVSYPKTWCDFGCAVSQLDPSGKFRSESAVWRWNATSAGVEVPLSTCCTAQGFSKECQCTRSPIC